MRGAQTYIGVYRAEPSVRSKGRRPWSGERSPLKLTTFSHLKDNLNNEDCTLLGIIYAQQFVKKTLLIYKLLDIHDRACNWSIIRLTLVK